jgi:hypothetical protein
MKLQQSLILFILSFIMAGCPASEAGKPPAGKPEVFPYLFMFYNLENLFHPSDDPSPADDPFTPEGERHWTWHRYNKKVTSVVKLILAAGGWEPPVFVGLCELENEKVLKDIVYHSLLADYHYHYLHRDSPDHRGIDVALLYRAEEIEFDTCAFIKNIIPGMRNGTREILHATFIKDSDTLAVYVNHWTSKYGGELETEDFRVFQAGLLGASVDSLLADHPSYKVIITGDFNDNSESSPLQALTKPGHIREIFPISGPGSYKYQGKWDQIDHMFIAGPWPLHSCKCDIFSAPYLIEDDMTYTGVKPFRTYAGFRYNGGISDHLPVLLGFSLGKDQGG